MISIADQVFDELEKDILSGVYERGEMLTEVKLSEQLGVSRTPIREALRRLAQERIIDPTSKGVRVVGITREDNGVLLTSEELFLCEGISVPPEQIAATERINIDYAQEAKEFLYRFVDTKSPCLSVRWKGESR